MVKNLILSGGSMKGLAYIGMIKCIEEYNIVKSIDNYVGTSIGACVCFCLLIVSTALGLAKSSLINLANV